MNSESETVEERARRETNEIVTATAIAYGLNCYPGGDIEGPYGEHSLTWLAIESYKKGAALASSPLQEKEQSYQDEREAQREFYLPANPTAEDISQARAIIAQQKSKLFEKEQRIKELEGK